MAKNKKALGRGLGALLQEVEEAYENTSSDNSELVLEIDVDLIKPNPFQPRKNFDEEKLSELAESIKTHGLLQPILIYETDEGYFLIAGERRLRATKLARIQTIKCILVEIKPEKLREMALIENIQREDLNPIDLALSYKALIDDYDITQDDLANRLQKSRTQITNTLALLRLPDDVCEMLISGKLSQGHAKILVNLDEKNLRVALDSIIGQKLTVRESENLVKKIKISNNQYTKKQAPDSELKDELMALKNALSKLNISSKISPNGILLKFNNKESITNFITRLKES